MKGQAPGAFDGSVPAVMPVTENETGTGTVTAGGVMAGSVITGGVVAGGGGILNVIQPGMSTSSRDKERKTSLFNLVTSHNI
jgi:RNA-splicing ligase RtcB